MQVVLLMFKDGEKREFAIKGAKASLGRREDCTFRIQSVDVSRKHCELSIDGGRLMVRDLGSSNGTFVNGKRIAESSLQAGDHLRVGPVTFAVLIDGKPAGVRAADLQKHAPPAKAGPSEDEVFELGADDFDIDDALTDIDFDDDDDDAPPPPPKKAKK